MKINLNRSDIEFKLKSLDYEINKLEEQKTHLKWLIEHWSYLLSEFKVAEESDKNVARVKQWRCPNCEYSCDKERGLKQHISHFHPVKFKTDGTIVKQDEPTTAKEDLSVLLNNLEILEPDIVKPKVVCLEDNCGKEFKNNAGLMVHISAAHRELTTLPPKKIADENTIPLTNFVIKPASDFDTEDIYKVKSAIIKCANPSCLRLKTFVQGSGKIYNGAEFCNGRCIADWKVYK
jgi:hypothetical protein